MNRILSLSLLVLLALAGCQGQDLPPVPPPPGGQVGVGGAIAGMAGFPSWAAKPEGITAPPSTRFGASIEVTVAGFDIVYQTGYVLSKQGVWQPFSLSGTESQGWIEGNARAEIVVEKDVFRQGENYAIVYACRSVQGAWECHDRKWMLFSFVVQESEPNLVECEDKACFEKQFSECRPAQFADPRGVLFEVIEPVEGKCRVRTVMFEHPYWEGTSMVCLYDPKQSFFDVSKEYESCEGTLKNLLAQENEAAAPEQEGEAAEDTEAPEEQAEPIIYVDIQFPKDTYEVGEPLTGAEYVLENRGNEPIDALIMTLHAREGVGMHSHSRLSGRIPPGTDENLSDFKSSLTRLNSLSVGILA